MKSLIDYSLNEEYEKVKRLGDRLAEVDSLYRSERKKQGERRGLRRKLASVALIIHDGVWLRF
ncbi:MAG TPA: hypothetical protein ENG09_03980 [Candidatus Syntrophoarchaeum butanivorans]|uniref:Uncharacterized protein n=1 Tax=Candidatus Syntropharchaeum butanivorans TaxID=1839936 RepID=A0A7C0X2Z4_9EURY|nr:hypothetical protein [Candidatus Syntrophoarchaeum butanivorans]